MWKTTFLEQRGLKYFLVGRYSHAPLSGKPIVWRRAGGQDKECEQLVLTVILGEIKGKNLQIEGVAVKERKKEQHESLPLIEIPAGDVLVSAWPVHPPYLHVVRS